MSEMAKLAVMLYGAGIEAHRVVEEACGIVRTNQILVESAGKRLSAICHRGSYGYESGLIECWDFSERDPIGWLMAGEAFAWFLERLGIGGGHER